MPTTANRYLVDPAVIAQSIGDETVLLDMRSELYLGLNQIGAAIWRGMEAGRSIDEIKSQLATDHPDTDAQKIAQDVDGLLAQLLDHKLITPQP